MFGFNDKEYSFNIDYDTVTDNSIMLLSICIGHATFSFGLQSRICWEYPQLHNTIHQQVSIEKSLY